MTLVVAQQKGTTIAVVSDTGVSEHGMRLPPAKQVPKICIINPNLANPNLAVAFAGNPDLATQSLLSFPKGGLFTYMSMSASCAAVGSIATCAAAMRAFQGWFRCRLGIANMMACRITSRSLRGSVSSQAMISGDVGSVTAPI
jgi:hypothetical protein